MHKICQAAVIFLATLLFYTGHGYADTVFLRDGDKLSGKVQNEYFAWQTSYGQLVMKKDFLKALALDDNRPRGCTLQTINNDFFHGMVLNENIQIILDNQTRATISMNEINQIFCDLGGPSSQILTTVFTMKNSDRFSGRLLDPQIKVRTDYMTSLLKPNDINRIDFVADARDEVRILLTNGDLIQGTLLLKEIQLAPDSLAAMSADKSEFSAIQFNARKMVIKEYGNLSFSEKDADGDGLPDQSDDCPHTPWGVSVDVHGCSKESATAAVGRPVEDKPAAKKGESMQPLDEDNDGVPDDLDRCPRTPLGAEVDAKGCWLLKGILFDFDSAEIKPQYFTVLDGIMNVMRKNPALKIEIQGNTDNIGPENYNRLLSEKRALMVKKFFAGKGIEINRLSVIGYGSAKTKASNETAAGRAANRRVDIVPLRIL